MTEPRPSAIEIDRFIIEEIDSVPHLEALLLLLHDPSKRWMPEDMARALYISPALAQEVLQELVQKRLITAASGTQQTFYYQPRSADTHTLIEALDQVYRREVVRISTMIHSKASRGVRDFARAFRFTKDRE